MFAEIVSGNDADLWLLIATILFAIACVISVADKVWVSALGYAGLTFVALGFLVV